MLQLENISYAHNPMFLDNGCVSLYTITRSLAFWIQAARYYTICIILYHVHHQNRCYVATLIAMPILFTLPTYRYRPSTILYTNNSHFDWSIAKFMRAEWSGYQKKRAAVICQVSSCRALKLWTTYWRFLAIDLPFCWWHFVQTDVVEISRWWRKQFG